MQKSKAIQESDDGQVGVTLRCTEEQREALRNAALSGGFGTVKAYVIWVAENAPKPGRAGFAPNPEFDEACRSLGLLDCEPVIGMLQRAFVEHCRQTLKNGGQTLPLKVVSAIEPKKK